MTFLDIQCFSPVTNFIQLFVFQNSHRIKQNDQLQPEYFVCIHFPKGWMLFAVILAPRNVYVWEDTSSTST